MKSAVFALLAFFSCTCLLGQDVNTSGDNSPAVIAENLSVTYGVRADAIEAILWIYEEEGYDVGRRKRATEQILEQYAQAPEKQQATSELTEATRSKMGIADAPKITNALEWDLFARNHYLSTMGHNSPAVMASGDVNIWYGISPKALRALAVQLEKNKTDLTQFEAQLGEQAKRYEELKTELAAYGSQEEIYRQAEALLEEGQLEEAEQLIEADYRASKKRQAYKGYVFGKAKELLLKYGEAAEGYKDAVFMDEANSTYHLYYAHNENTLAHYDNAIKHYEIALGIDSLKSGNEEVIATLFNNLGGVWSSKGAYGKALGYYERALQIDLQVFSENDPNVARDYNNLGSIYYSQGAYNRAIGYFEKALEIDVQVLGQNHPSIATGYNNLGGAWSSKGAYDKAIEYYGKALQIAVQAFGENHPSIAIKYNNLGLAWYSKGVSDKALEYFDKALQIYMKVFGGNHPSIATVYDNIGLVWSSKGDYDKAIEYYEKALQIGLAVLGESHPEIAEEYNNLGTAWDAKESYDKAIGYFEQALQINMETFGENHSNVASVFNNLGGAWSSKGDYDQAIEYYEQALQIFLETFDENHPNVALVYNNLGATWYSKEFYDKAIEYYEKALIIDSRVFGENHPSVARDYNNLGETWREKSAYDKAIEYFEKSQVILDLFFEPTHPNQKATAGNLSRASNSRGMELDSEKRPREALGYFQKALENTERAKDDAFSLICLNNIGSMQKQLENYEAGLQSLNLGLQKAAQINQEFEQAIKERFSPEMLANPEVQAKIADVINRPDIRRMQYHKISCLKGLEREEEADALAEQLWLASIAANDIRLLEDLRKEGYDFGN